MSSTNQYETSYDVAVDVSTPTKGSLRYPNKQKWNESSFDLVAGDKNYTPRRELRGVDTPLQFQSTQSASKKSLIVNQECCAVTSSVEYNIVSPVPRMTPENKRPLRHRPASAPRNMLRLTDEPKTAEEKPTFKIHAQRRRFERRDSDVLCTGVVSGPAAPYKALRHQRSQSVDSAALPAMASLAPSEAPVTPQGGPLIDERSEDLNAKRNDLRAPGPAGGYGFPSSVQYNILSNKDHSGSTEEARIGAVVAPSWMATHSRKNSAPAAPQPQQRLAPGPGIDLSAVAAASTASS